MNPNAKINIKDLPQIQQISNGDYLIVESNDGTYILDYENLILGVENTAITTAVQQNTTDISSISGAVDAQLAALSSTVAATYSRVYVGKALVSIESGASKTAFLSPRPSTEVGNINIQDITITPANVDACAYPAFISAIDNTEDSRGLFTITALINKKTYVVTGAATSDINVTTTGGLNTSTGLSAYTVSQFLNGVQGYADPTKQPTPYTVTETSAPSTADQLGIRPAYNVLVIKPY